MLDWDDLRSFLAVARHGNLSAAARALKVTQTTMGRRLEGLHERSGARLLQRTPQGFVLTPAGEGVMSAVERMEVEALLVERRISGQDMRLEGVVRVATVEALGSRILTPILARMRARHPGIAVDFTTDSRSVSLARREADIAVRLAEFQEQDAVVRRAAEMAVAAYAAPDYLSARGQPDFAQGAPGHARITFPEGLDAMPEARWLARMTQAGEVAFTSNSRDAQMQAAIGGMGIAAVPRFMGDEAPGLVRLATPEPAPLRGIWIGVHADTRHTPRIRAVVEALHEGLRAAAPVLAPPP
jgi:DNA-binding transcriptional LysR family regulator